MKVAHQWEFRGDMNKKGLACITILGQNQRPKLTKPFPLCFVCNVSVLKHLLEDSKTFKTFANKRTSRVVDVGKYLS